MKTVFLTVTNCVNVRDILRGGVLRTLRQSGHRIVILTPAHDDPEFVNEFSSGNVVVEPLRTHQPGALEQRLNTLRYTLFPELSETVRYIVMTRRERGAAKQALAAAGLGVKRVLGARRTKGLLRWANVHLFPDTLHADLFQKYRPDLVILTELFNMAPDAWVLKRAARLKIPTVLVVRSWDNLTSKGIFPAAIDRLVVWGETMRDEAQTVHEYPRERVHIAGAAHFDCLCDLSSLPNRTEFCQRIGADPSKALITYAMATLTRRQEGMEIEIVRRLCRMAQDNAFGRPAQVLVRLYPLLFFDVSPRLAEIPGVLLDVPGRTSKSFRDRDFSEDDMRHLAATLHHSDVVVNVASTISLDAAVVGAPAVCVGFDVDKSVSHADSIERYYELTHYHKLLSYGAVRLARDMDRLVEDINAYLADRSLDAPNRARMLNAMCYKLDGRSGDRIGQYILQYLEEFAPVREGAPRPAAEPVMRLEPRQ